MARRNFEIEQIEALKGVRTIRHHYSTHLRFLDRITHQIAVQSQKVAVLQGKVDELRIELHAVMRERKTLEKLEEKELSLWQKEQRRLDQKEMDEFAAASYLLHRSAALPVEAALRGSKKETRK
jgi:flagellar export protein FliJ